MKRSRTRGGFTLIEIIIAIAISAIVGVFLMTFLTPQIRIYGKMNSQENAKTECAAVMNAIRKNIHDGKNFIYTDGNGTDTSKITFLNITGPEGEGTEISFDGNETAKNLYPDLKERKISVAFDLLNANYANKVVGVTITVTENNESSSENSGTETGTAATGNVLYTLTENVRCQNIGL
jgi:prepilin-type N-terminal cleavage/methylation domain-containing protein